MDFSLIVPCYNEAQNVRTFFATATECLDAADMAYELVFVDDGSSDGTMAVVRAEIDTYRLMRPFGRGSFTVVRLSRNFGKEAALYAGLERADGAYVGFIDADMQQDPAVALKMMHFLRDHDEFDCVVAVQDKRHESLPMRMFKGMFYRLFNSMSELHIVANASDFRVFRKPVADALVSLREQFRFSKGLFSWVGFDTYVMPYEVHERLAGTSRWTVRKLFSYAWNGVLAFSTWPLKAIMWIGMILALVSLVLLGMDVYQNTVSTDPLSMSQMLMDVVLLLGGVQMFVLGVIGEYVAARVRGGEEASGVRCARRVRVARDAGGGRAGERFNFVCGRGGRTRWRRLDGKRGWRGPQERCRRCRRGGATSGSARA